MNNKYECLIFAKICFIIFGVTFINCNQTKKDYQSIALLLTNKGSRVLLESERRELELTFYEIKEGDVESMAGLLVLLDDEKYSNQAIEWCVAVGQSSIPIIANNYRRKQALFKRNAIIVFRKIMSRTQISEEHKAMLICLMKDNREYNDIVLKAYSWWLLTELGVLADIDDDAILTIFEDDRDHELAAIVASKLRDECRYDLLVKAVLNSYNRNITSRHKMFLEIELILSLNNISVNDDVAIILKKILDNPIYRDHHSNIQNKLLNINEKSK